MQHDDHANLDVSFAVVEEQHEIDFDVLDRVAESSSVFSLALELFSRLYPADDSDHVDYREVLFFQDRVDSLKLSRQGGEEDPGLADDVRILVKCYLQLFFL